MLDDIVGVIGFPEDAFADDDDDDLEDFIDLEDEKPAKPDKKVTLLVFAARSALPAAPPMWRCGVNISTLNYILYISFVFSLYYNIHEYILE